MCLHKCVHANVFMQMCLYKCVPANVFIQMCLCRCVFTNMFVQMCSCKCVCKRVCTNVSSHYCIVQLSFGYCPVIVRYLPKSCIIDSCSSPSDSLISLSYSMATFSANSFGLFIFIISTAPVIAQRQCTSGGRFWHSLC